jgi:sulfide:quinone oxidoreductase
MIAPEDAYTYRPLAVAEPFGLAERFRVDLNAFSTSEEVGIHIGEVDRVDADNRSAHTANGTSYDYDYLVIATGAQRKPSLRNAISFVDAEGVSRFKDMLYRLEGGQVEAVAFSAGSKVGWFLPMYELALMTATFAQERNTPVELAVVTPESTPLIAFGPQNSDDVAKLLESAGIAVHASSHPVRFEDHELAIVPEGTVPADEVVAMPDLEGPAIPGLPADPAGFIPVDDACRIVGREREYAAGDATNFPVKQGGIAAQMAQAVARAIAVDVGALVDAKTFRPTLDGTLLSGKGAHHLRQSLAMGSHEERGHQLRATWIPLEKVNATYLIDYLAEHTAFPGASGELDSDEVASGLIEGRERRVAGQ